MMRVRFDVENPQKLKAGFHSKMVLTQQGGILGASPETDWPLQDTLNTIPDYLARIEALDNRFVITAFPGAQVYLNGSSSPLRPNRKVFLRADDEIAFGNLKLRMRDEFFDDHDLDYMQLDDAVEVSSRVTINQGHRGIIDAEAVVVDEPQARVKDWTARNQWQNRVLVQDHRRDPIFGLEQTWATQSEDQILSPHLMEHALRESEGPTDFPFAQDLKRKAKMQSNSEKSDRFGFDDFKEVETIENPSQAEMPSDDVVKGNALLIAISKSLGIPLSQLADEDLLMAVSEIAESLRVSVQGVHAIYRQNQNTKNAAFSQFNRNAIDDNPLRFSATADDALKTMYLERSAVHLAPVAALKESLADLRKHDVATESGIEAGLKAITQAFNPDNLEQRFQSYKRSEMPPEGDARDAWKWRLFEAYFEELIGQRQNSLNKFFWEIFNNAYQKTMRDQDNNLNQKNEDQE